MHKQLIKQHPFTQVYEASKTLVRIRLLRVMAIIMSALAIVELFKSEFGQLYMLRYVDEPQKIGLLWAAYAFAWALGSALAYRCRTRLTLLVIATTVPLVLMACIDTSFSLILFMVQAVASSSLLNQISTRIQENTPSAVRASVLSVVLAAGRAISIPASILLGWIFTQFGAFWALRSVAVVAAGVLIYWLWSSKQIPRANRREVVSVESGMDQKPFSPTY